MNDMLGGINSGNVKKQLAEEAQKFEPSIKSEYFKMAGTNEKHIAVPSQVKWKTCAHKSETTCATYSRDGDIIYSGGADGVVKGWRTSDGKELSTMTMQGAVTDVCASFCNEYLLASNLHLNNVILFRTKTNNKFLTYTGHTDTVNASLFNYSKKHIITSSDDCTVRHWDQMTQKEVR